MRGRRRLGCSRHGRAASLPPCPILSRSLMAGCRFPTRRSFRLSKGMGPVPTSGGPRGWLLTARYGDRRRIEWLEVFAGEKAKNQFDNWLPDDTLTAIKRHLVAIKGPLTTPIGGGFRSLNVALRQQLDLYACVRPVRYFTGVPSPVKAPELVDMVIFRENTEDIYAGIEFRAGTTDAQRLIKFVQDELGARSIRFPGTSGIGIKPISQEGSARLIRSAIDYAIAEKRKSVTLVHKGNIMKY